MSKHSSIVGPTRWIANAGFPYIVSFAMCAAPYSDKNTPGWPHFFAFAFAAFAASLAACCCFQEGRPGQYDDTMMLSVAR